MFPLKSPGRESKGSRLTMFSPFKRGFLVLLTRCLVPGYLTPCASSLSSRGRRGHSWRDSQSCASVWTHCPLPHQQWVRTGTWTGYLRPVMCTSYQPPHCYGLPPAPFYCSCLYACDILSQRPHPDEETWQLLHHDPELSGYGVMSLSPDQQWLALGSLQGSVSIMMLDENGA